MPKKKELAMNKVNFYVCIDLCMYISKMLYDKYNHNFRGICVQRCQLIKPVSVVRFIHPRLTVADLQVEPSILCLGCVS